MNPLKVSELYKQLLDGDESARDQLFTQLYVSFRVLARHRLADWDEAEEAVQAAMVKVSGKLDQLAKEGSFAAWAHRILHNAIVDRQRVIQNRRRRESGLDVAEVYLRGDEECRELRSRLKNCLKEINAEFGRHARVLVLKYQGYRTAEICKKMSITPNNLYVTLSRARALLKACLERERKGK
jgi:RNA polymerase sigma factor (sigma-70 family)